MGISATDMASKFLLWICFFCIYAHLTNGNRNIDQWILPVANLDATMEGYDPIMADPFDKPDPGIRSQIFEPFKADVSVTGVADLNSFIGKAREDLHCESTLTEKTFRNYEQFNKEKFSSQTYSAGADVIVKIGIPILSFKASAGYGRRSNTNEASFVKYFQENNGEIVEMKSECITHTVNISPFVQPVFTHSFLEALKLLDSAAKDPKSERSKKIFSLFVKTFGTHFMRSTALGAKLVYQKLFLSTTTDTKSKDERNDCVSHSAYASLGGRYKIASVSASFKTDSSNCSNSSLSNAYFQENGMSSTSVISIGSLPSTTLDGWVSRVKESPVPIQIILDKISNMFVSFWFDTMSITDNENNSEKMNGTAMHKFFEEMSASYCSIMLGKDCPVEEKGCGINSLCKPGTTCVEDQDSQLGYRCNIKYGGAIIAGGDTMGGFEQLSDVEALDTYTLPDLLTATRGLTLSVVGTTFFACGGSTDPKACFYIDRSITSPSWTRLTNDIPVEMIFHSAAVIGSYIWLVYKNKLYDLDSTSHRWRTYSLAFVVTAYQCAVSNDTHTYIIGVGSTKKEIWVNTEASEASRWHKVAEMEHKVSSHACVWLGNKVYITGGYRPSNLNNDVEVFDTITNTVTKTGSLNVGRDSHGMMVLNGQPAVLGGSGVIADRSAHLEPVRKELNSIETYDVATGQWTTRQRTMEIGRFNFGIVQLRE